MVFPRGKFDYVWSPYIDDAYAAFEDSWGDWGDELADLMVKSAKAINLFSDDEMDDDEMDDDEIISQIHDLPSYSDKRNELIEWVLEHHLRDLYKFNKDINAAQYKSGEIMVMCDKYYAIHEGQFEHRYDINFSQFMRMLKKPRQ